MKSDDQRPADSKRRCSQIARRAEQHRLQRLGVWLVLLQIQSDNLRAFRRHDAIDLLGQRERVLRRHLRLASINLLDRRHRCLAQELLSFDARRSARTVIAPINLHGCLPEIQQRDAFACVVLIILPP